MADTWSKWFAYRKRSLARPSATHTLGQKRSVAQSQAEQPFEEYVARLISNPQHSPPITYRVQYTDDRDAVRAGLIEYQVIFEFLDPPFAERSQVTMIESQRRAHLWLVRQVGEACFGVAQEMFG